MGIHIIGGAGFIGTRLCHRFEKKRLKFNIIDKVSSVAYPDLTSIADVRSAQDLTTNISKKSIIINLAAEHRDDVTPPSLYYDVNVSGAQNVCAAAIANNVTTIVFTSSVAVYGFASIGTNEDGVILPFNEYGKSKYDAELIYKTWQKNDPMRRTLVILRPTVVFGESNRGNVFNLLKQIASGRFVMVGNGNNRKSMVYVENIAAFIEYSLTFNPGLHVYNYIDKPDFTMNSLVGLVNKILGKSEHIQVKIPYFIGLGVGLCFDFFAVITGKKFNISSIRIKKFCSNSVYESAVSDTGFIPPVHLLDAIERTVKYEFLEDHKLEKVFFTE
jgi:nucleoside-diphosphate-sugar epimerase